MPEESNSYSLRELYQELAEKKIAVSVANEYLHALTQLGYCADPFVKASPRLSAYVPGIIIAAEYLYLVSTYSRQQALETALHSLVQNNPEVRALPGVHAHEDVSILTYFVENNEKFFVGILMALFVIGVFVGMSVLLFPQHGFMSTQDLLGSVSKLYPIR